MCEGLGIVEDITRCRAVASYRTAFFEQPTR